MNYTKILFYLTISLFISSCANKEDKAKPSIQEPQITIEESIQTPTITEDTIPQTAIATAEKPDFAMSSIKSQYLYGDYANNYKLKKFIDKMVNRYNFKREYLYGLFSNVNRDTSSLKKYKVYKKPSKKKHKTGGGSGVGSWDKYPRFANADRTINGVKFWRENKKWLDKASRVYNVAPEYLVGIIGVETNYGRDKGKHRLLDALTSLSLEYKKRSKFFTKQLEEYLLLTREQKLNPLEIYGSYGGAFGLVQFMPDSFRDYAVDFDGDGIKNLFNPADAIGSTANFFIKKGKWNPNIPVAMRVNYDRKRFNALPTGYKTEYSQNYLISLGMRPTSNFYGYKGPVSLIKLSKYDRDELWWGTKNFYAIGRYNPRDYYIMSVHQLAQAVRKRYYGQ